MILAVVGMKREAALLARVGVRALVGGGAAGQLARIIDEALSLTPAGLVLRQAQDEAYGRLTRNPHPEPVEGRGFRPRKSADEGRVKGLLSFGVAGGLDPLLKAGDLVIASGVVDSPGRPTRPLGHDVDAQEHSPSRPGGPGLPLAADPAWAARLGAALPGARIGLISGQETPVSTSEDKAALFAATEALACDMESHVVAAAAARHGLPFAAIRAVSDPAGRSLPAAALAGFGADGEADIVAVLRDLARNPRQFAALVRTGVQAERAFRALGKIVVAINPGLLAPPAA